jgi:DNA repair protein RadC
MATTTTAIQRYRVKTIRVSLACDLPTPEEQISIPHDAARVARAIYQRLDLDPDCEHFLILSLNTRGRVNGFRVIATGTLSATLVHPREVFRSAILLGAAQIILVHNHPSLDVSPSDEDFFLTQRLREAGEILGIPVIDHLILGAPGQFTTV